METVVVVLMIVVCFNYLLKQTYRKTYFVLLSALIAAVFVSLTWPYAIEQTKTQISDWLNNPSLMRDTSVILSFDVILQMTFCMVAAHVMTTGQISKRTLYLYKVLRWFPGILIYPVLFSMLVAVIFSFPGHSFEGVAYTLGAVLFVAIPALSWFIKWLLPEKELRLELLFLCNALIAILGIISTVNGQTAVEGQSEVNWSALGGLVLLLLAGAVIGYILRIIYLKKKLHI